VSYTTEPMDSLPSIAEAWGHSGEWQAISEMNPDLPDPHNIQPGMEILIPVEWLEREEESTSTTSSNTKSGTTTSKSSSTTSSSSNTTSSTTSSGSGSA
jgi:hypothetical protein